MMMIIVILLLIIIAINDAAVIKPSPHQCIHYTNKIRKQNGWGDTVGACMNCNTARPECYGDCQPQLDLVKQACTGVCLPEGYYFDSSSTLNGCWDDIKRQIGIEMEKCGCNSANNNNKSYIFILITIISLLYFIIYT
jgi:hypothetical protein